MSNEEAAKKEAARCAKIDIENGRKANPQYWHASEGSAWADWYLAAYEEQSKQQQQ